MERHVSYLELPPDNVVQAIKINLGEAEEIRAKGSGETGISDSEKYTLSYQYAEAIFNAAKTFIETSQNLSDNQRSDIILGMAGAAFMAAGSLQSFVNHSKELSKTEQEKLIEQARSWIELIDNPLIKRVTDAQHRTLHGPIIWEAEKNRLRARTFYAESSLREASEFYKKAFEESKTLVESATKEAVQGAMSAQATAMIEYARVQFEMYQGGSYETELDINDIYEMFMEGAVLNKRTEIVPNIDRLDTNYFRVIKFLITQVPDVNHPDLRWLIRELYELENLEQQLIAAPENRIINKRNRQRERDYPWVFKGKNALES